MKTPMIDRIMGNKKKAEDQFTGPEPVGRIGQHEEIANAGACMFCDDASFATRLAISVDGSFVAQ
nr:SDR family oxidoreductase [Flavobacterium urumqiense]